MAETTYPIPSTRTEFPLLALRDVVVFPGVQVGILVKRQRSLSALEEATRKDRIMVFTTQRTRDVEDPQPHDLYQTGVIGQVKEVLKSPDDSVRVVVEGMRRVAITEFTQSDPYFRVRIRPIEEIVSRNPELEAMNRQIVDQFKQVVALGEMVPLDALITIFNTSQPSRLTDLIGYHMDIPLPDRQGVLETVDLKARMEKLKQILARKIESLGLERKVQAETQEQLSKMQKEVILREQLKAIEKELGIKEEREEIEEMREAIKKAGMSKEVKAKAEKELGRLEKMTPMSPEYSYIRTYLDWLTTVPWSKKGKARIDVKEAEKILDNDHYGLKKPKERILEYLAVQKLVGKIKGPILCFVGPPGVGKTSIGKSIAKAMGRKFAKMSLGGIRDEAEIRGHRRTYVGAMPGRIIQGIKNAGESNPVFMLDEIDKVGTDFRGDPSSALLEALDPEQNNAFSDHYLEVPYDLSDVLFITTANMLDTIPPALRDRLEVISFSGYTEEEKFHIANQYLIPKIIENHGLKKEGVTMTEPALRTVIREYTREAGVRNLERELASVFRKIARSVAEGKKIKKDVTIDDVHTHLGAPKYFLTMAEKRDEIGVVTGLAWTEAGGEILQIEATKMPGKGQLILTGQLGDAMKESVQAALLYTRTKAKQFKIKDRFDKIDLHIHVPAGATPKDGPSAGLAMATALISVLTGKKVKREIAMTGEITLRGRALEIGGVKEKIIAAHRAGVKKIILPLKNKKDLEEDVPDNVRKDLEFIFVEHVDEVLKVIFKKS
ncbi:MAG TPA: endopeptidase La [Patescibacteria group bacterium]|nr:endopeptidase La [Patescibacteria group bacterium]